MDLGLIGKDKHDNRGKKEQVTLEKKESKRKNILDIEGVDTHVFHRTETGTGFPDAWQVSTTFVRPTYQLLS